MTTMHLNSQVQKGGGCAHGLRVFGRTPNVPIGRVPNPHFSGFVNHKAARAIETHHLHVVIHQIRQASLTGDFNGELNLYSGRRFPQLRNTGFPLDQSAFSVLQIEKRKGGDGYAQESLLGIWGVGWGYALVHFRGSYLEVALE